MPLRTEFPIFKNNEKNLHGKPFPFVYLDSAVSAQKPQAVIHSMVQHWEHDYGAVHRGSYGVSVRSSDQYEAARQKVAAFIGKNIRPEQVIFTKNTTESLNLVASGLSQMDDWNEHSRIVVPMCEHHSNLVPWQQAALRTDCELAYIPLLSRTQLQLNLAEAQKLISTRTKVVSLAHMGNVLGQINPVPEVAAMARKVGAHVVLDCAQSATCLEDDPFAWGVSAVALSGHKLYGPTGIGVLVLSPELAERLPPLLFGGGMVSAVTLEESRWARAPMRFEGGTPPITEAIGLGAAVDWLNGVGRARIHAHASRLASLFIEKMEALPEIEVYSPKTGQETLVSFRHKKLHAHDVTTILDTHNVAMRAGHHCAWPLIQFLGVEALVRASFAAYSDVDDVERAVEVIKHFLKFA